MKKVIITGINGYVGRYLFNSQPQNSSIIGGIRSAEKHIQNLSDYFILNLEKPIKKQLNNIDADILIHTAAMANLGQCEKYPDLAHQINSAATSEIAQWCTEKNVRMIYLSTDIVFKGDSPPYIETDSPNPINQYGKTKLQGENEIISVLDNYAVIRIALALGKGLGGTKNFLDWFIERLNSAQTISLFSDEIRTPSAVPELVNNIWKIALSRENGIFHLAGAQSLNRYELGKGICKVLKIDSSELKSISLNSMRDYPRPVDVSLKSTRKIDGEIIKLPPILNYLPKLLYETD